MSPEAILRTAAWILALSLPAGPAAALSTDSEQPIRIESQRASMSLEEGNNSTLYEGDVLLIQGSLRLEAHSLRAYGTSRRPDRVVAEGAREPARLYQRMDDGGEIRAEAGTIEFLADKGIILLLKNAQIWQGPNTIAAERIEYDLSTGTVNAGGDTPEGDGGRVEVIIAPDTLPESGQP